MCSLTSETKRVVGGDDAGTRSYSLGRTASASLRVVYNPSRPYPVPSGVTLRLLFVAAPREGVKRLTRPTSACNHTPNWGKRDSYLLLDYSSTAVLRVWKICDERAHVRGVSTWSRWTLLCLESDARSMIKRLRRAKNDDAPPLRSYDYDHA